MSEKGMLVSFVYVALSIGASSLRLQPNAFEIAYMQTSTAATRGAPASLFDDRMKQLYGDELTIDLVYDDHVDFNAAYVSGDFTARADNGERQPVFWLHLHQNAGTWLRVTALNSGERPLSPHDSNLNSFVDGDTCKTPMPCKEKLSLLRHQNASWTSIERSFDIELEYCAGDFLYGLGITDPRVFVHKSLEHVPGLHPELLIDVLQRKREISAVEVMDAACWGAPPYGANGIKVGGQFPQFDNFIIRSLLGHNVFWLPPGSINQAHLEKAKEVISKFDVVLIINRLTEHFVQLEHRVQWQASMVESPPVHSNGGFTPNALTFNENQTMFLMELNKLDQELFHFAENIAHALSATAAANTTP